MTETNPTTPINTGSLFSRGNTWKIAGLIVLSALAGAALSRGVHHWRGHHGWGHFGMSGPIDPADVDRKVAWMTGKFANDVNASSEQREKLEAIAKSAAKDLMPMRDTLRQARSKARDLLTSPTVDKAAIESLRAEQITTADTLSKRLSAALTDAAEVLSPEQRKQLSERMAKHEGRHGWGWRDGGDKG